MDCGEVERQDLIERYLRLELAEPERDAFELHYFSCDSCFQQLEAARAVRTALKPGAPAPQRKGRGAWWWGAGALTAAATVLLLVFPRTTVQAPTEAPQAQAALLRPEEVEPPAYAAQVFRGGPAAGAEFTAAMSRYQARDYAGAARGLRALAGRPGTSAEVWHFLGASLLMSGMPAEGVEWFDRVIALGSGSPYEEEARFGRAQGLLLAGRRAEARRELEHVAGMRGDYEARSRRLLGSK